MDQFFTIKAENLEKTDKIAQAVAEAIKGHGGLICLYGDIGAGKTTLVKSIAKYLNVQEKVTSPSFVILNEYHSGIISLYHFDLYRLEEEGVKTILDEIREYSEDENAVALIEWAEFSSGELPDDRLEISIKYLDETSRDFTFKAFGSKAQKSYNKIMKSLS